MKTVFQDLLLLTYAVAPEDLAALLPTCVHPYVRDGRSYISIVVGNMRGMRPGILPEFLGTSYYQIVYRAVVRLRRCDGHELPGVFFLRSDSNDPVMSYFGNRLTEFRFHYFQTGAIALFSRGADLLVSVQTKDKGGDLVACLRDLGTAEQHPPARGFSSVADEKGTLVQLFHAYAHDAERGLLYDLEIERGEWHLHRLALREHFAAYFTEAPFNLMSGWPVSQVYIRECSYVWKPMQTLAAEEFMCR